MKFEQGVNEDNLILVSDRNVVLCPVVDIEFPQQYLVTVLFLVEFQEIIVVPFDSIYLMHHNERFYFLHLQPYARYSLVICFVFFINCVVKKRLKLAQRSGMVKQKHTLHELLQSQ